MNKRIYSLLLFVISIFMTISVLADSPRKGLIEEATQTNCGPCASQNPTFQQWFLSNLDILVPVVYHAWWPGANNDPFFLNDQDMNRTRIQYYAIGGVPTAYFQGTQKVAPASCPTQVNLNALRTQTSPLTITIEEKWSGNTDDVKVTVHSSQAISGKKLRIVVLEYYVEFPTPPGTNGEKEFFCTSRKMLPDANGIDFSIAADETKEFNQSFTIKSGWQKSQIYVAAFIQDDGSKEVLQAEHSLKTLSAPLSMDDRYLSIDGSSSLTKDFEVENTTASSLQVKLSVNTAASSIPAGWEAKLSDYTVTVPANSKKKVQLTIKTNDQAGFAVVDVVSEPIASNIIVVKKSLIVTALSNNTKYALYVGNNGNVNFLYNAIKGNSKYGPKTAALPLTNDILVNYNPVEKFDLVIFSYDFWHRSYLTNTGTGYSNTLAKALKSMVANGKKIFITGELELYNAGQSYADPEGRSFLNQTLGITYNGNPPWRITIDGNGYITGIKKFNAKGMSGDPIGNGIDITMNDYTDLRNDPYILATDIIRAVDTKAVPFLYYDNAQNNIGGVRITNGNSKAVYVSFGFEAIKNVTQRNQLVGKILDWLFSGGGSTLGPQIEFSGSKLDYGEVKVNNSKELTLTLSNIGDEDLIINELSMDADYDPDGVFTFKSGNTTPITIAPGGTHDVVVNFTPIATEDYSGILTVKSNSNNDGEYLVDLEGTGKATQGPVIASDKEVLDFGNVEENKSKIGDIVIMNEGTEDIIISNIRIDNNADGSFSFVTGNDATKIEPGKDITLTVKFTPPSVGTHVANVVVQSNAVNESAFNVRVVGNGFATSVPEEVTSSDGAITLKATPNPMGANGTITYTLNTVNTGSFNMYMMDMTGRRVANLVSGSVSTGTHTLDFNTANLSSGTYVIIAEHNGSIAKLPFVIVK